MREVEIGIKQNPEMISYSKGDKSRTGRKKDIIQKFHIFAEEQVNKWNHFLEEVEQVAFKSDESEYIIDHCFDLKRRGEISIKILKESLHRLKGSKLPISSPVHASHNFLITKTPQITPKNPKPEIPKIQKKLVTKEIQCQMATTPDII